MKTLQDIQDDQIFKYMDKAVESLPKKIRKVFEEDRIRFIIDKEDRIGIKGLEDLDEKLADEVCMLLCKYFEENPSPFLSPIVLH